MKSPFHTGELQAQQLAGFDVVAHGIREAMPEQHQLFFAALPYLFISTLDDNGWPVATLLSGPAGFIRAPDDGHLRVNAPRRTDDPALAALQPGKQIGALGIDFSNRRRGTTIFAPLRPAPDLPATSGCRARNVSPDTPESHCCR